MLLTIVMEKKLFEIFAKNNFKKHLELKCSLEFKK